MQPVIALDHGPQARPALFIRPRELLLAWSRADVADVLDRAEAARRAGGWIAGYIAYEAGYAFEPRLSGIPHHDPRAPLVTLGGGIVLQCAADRLSRRDASAIERVRGLLAEAEVDRADAAVYFLGARDWSAVDLACEMGVDEAMAQALIDQLRKTRRLVELSDGARRAVLLHADRCVALETHLLDVLRKLHAAAPIDPVVSRQKVPHSHARHATASVSPMFPSHSSPSRGNMHTPAEPSGVQRPGSSRTRSGQSASGIQKVPLLHVKALKSPGPRRAGGVHVVRNLAYVERHRPMRAGSAVVSSGVQAKPSGHRHTPGLASASSSHSSRAQ